MKLDLLTPERKLGAHYGVRHFIANHNGKLSVLVGAELALSEARLHELLNLGAIYKNNERCLAEVEVVSGEQIRVHTTPRRFAIDKIDFAEAIVFENFDFIVINKPADIPVHATVDNCRENLLSAFSSHLAQPLFTTHRLDTPTQGLLVFAKNLAFQSQFNELLRQGLVRKIYRASVEGNFSSYPKDLGEPIVHFMEPSPRAPKRVSSEPVQGWLECVLKILCYKFLSPSESLLEVELITGRTHQIRAQLAALGYPILGDTSYGARPHSMAGIALQCHRLEFKLGSEVFGFAL